MSAVLVGDVGGSRIKLGVVVDGRVVARRVIAAEAATGLAARLPAIADAWRVCAEQAGVAPRHAALALPMAIDAAGTRVLGTPAGKFADATALDLPAWAAGCGWSLRLEHDARAALAGEAAAGALRGRADAAIVMLGTGIGVAVRCAGRTMRGAGQAGLMLGHLPSGPGPACMCGRQGCAEARAGAWAFRRDGLPWPGPQRAHAVAVWTDVLETICTAYDPAAIALGGGLVAADPALVGDLAATLAARPRLAGPPPQVVASMLGEDGPLIGLAAGILEST
jgi:glucokinase